MAMDIKEIRELFDDELWVIENAGDYHPRDVEEARSKVEAMNRIIKHINWEE